MDEQDKITRAVAKAVAAAPPLTAEQKDRIRDIFGSVPKDRAEPAKDAPREE